MIVVRRKYLVKTDSSIKILIILVIFLSLMNLIEIYQIHSNNNIVEAKYNYIDINLTLFKNSDYIIINESGVTKAINGKTGYVEYEGDATKVIQYVNDIIDEGNTIYLMSGTYIVQNLHLKPINLIGSGKSTILKLADNSNGDVIESYSGGNLNDRYYYKRGKIANLKIDGNKDNQNTGNGIVLAWTEEYTIENVWVDNVKDYGIKILRSYWTSLRDISISNSTNGIKVGEYDKEGKYDNLKDADLFSNENTFTNVHIECTNNGIGIKIESGDANNFIGSDTSSCGIGVLLKAVEGVDHVYKNNFIGHWFESDDIGIKMENGGNAGTRYTYIINPVFSYNRENVNSSNDSGHYLIMNYDGIDGGTYSPDISLYRLFVKYGIYKGSGDRIYVQDPASISDIYNMRTYSGDYGGDFSNFTPPDIKGIGHFFFAMDSNVSRSAKRMYVSFNGSTWDYITFSD